MHDRFLVYSWHMKLYNFSIVIEQDKDGYFAFCPELQGCYTQGETYEEAMANIKDVINLHLEDRTAVKEQLPEIKSVSLSSFAVAF